MSAMGTAALQLAARGWAVFPCREFGPNAKAPYTTNGHLDATVDREQVLAWWREWPDAMIGAPVPSTFLVIDIDPRNGGSVDALEARVGPLPDTLTAWSGRGDGGRHFYYLRPGGAFVSTGLPAGVDLKVNGYCILPPSIHPASGEPYRWDVQKPAALSLPLLALLRPPPARVQTWTGTVTGRGEPLVRHVLTRPEGERNRGLFWAACRAVDDGLLGEIRDDLLRAAQSIGLSEREARRTIDSAEKQVAR